MKVEKLSMDNIFATYVLWKEYIAEINSESTYFKITEEKIKSFVYDHSMTLNNGSELRLIVKHGRHVVGFMFGSFINRADEPKVVFSVNSLYCKNKEVEQKLFKVVKESVKSFGIKHIECNEIVRNSLKDEAFKEVLKLYSLEV